MRRYSLAIALTFIVSLIAGAGAAQAVVLSVPAVGYVGARLVPGTDPSVLSGAGIMPVTSPAPCIEANPVADMLLRDNSLCWHGGPVIHRNETFAFVWDPRPTKNYAAGYEEQFLRDVADGSGTFSSPYAETAQYTDGRSTPDVAPSNDPVRAANASIYGGGFDDNSTAYPTDPPRKCTKSDGVAGYPNDYCINDSAIQSELSAMIQNNGIMTRLKPGYTPLIVLVLPPGVEACIDTAGDLCSANSDPSRVSARFCSYHSQLGYIPYIVQPWTARFDTGNGVGKDCDEPDVPAIPSAPTSAELAQDMGARLVSPLSQAQIASIINPNLTGWFAMNGTESDDNGCMPQGQKIDQVTVGNSSQNPYLLQREFNNGGSIVANDPFAMACVGGVVLNPVFVVPSAVNQGDVVQFDGETTQTTLLVPNENFKWDFGDGTTAVGPSQVHVYTKGGTYTVKLTVTDRGGDAATLSQSIVVLDKNGQVVVPGGSAGGTGAAKTPLRVRIQLMPQAFKTMLRSGISIVVTSNQNANAIVTLSIPRSAAKRAHIKAGRGPAVVIGRGTASKITAGSGTLRLRLPASTVKKLGRLRHVTVTVRMALVAAGNSRTAVVAAARF